MSATPGWLGRLDLAFERSEHGTKLARSLHEGPLRIQRVLYPEGPESPHVYLLHPPGGVVGGDRLEMRVELAARAQVLCTTPAAQKLYRSAGAECEISNLLRVAAGAQLEWLPSETLAFSAARAKLSTRVELEPGAAFVGWDIACYGMPARGEVFEEGRVVSRLELLRSGTPLLVESLELGASRELLDAAFALRGQPVVANLYAVPASAGVPEQLLEQLREALAEPSRCLCSVSSLGELIVVRALGPNVEGVRSAMIRAWQLLRPVLFGREAVTPRIWAT